MDMVLITLNYKQPFCIKVVLPSSSDFPKPIGVDIRAEGCIFYGVPVDGKWRDDDWHVGRACGMNRVITKVYNNELWATVLFRHVIVSHE